MLSLSCSLLPYWVVLLFLSKYLFSFKPISKIQSRHPFPVWADTLRYTQRRYMWSFILLSRFNSFFRLYSLQDWDFRLARIIHTITERALCTVHPPFSHCIYFYFKCYIDTPQTLPLYVSFINYHIFCNCMFALTLILTLRDIAWKIQ